MHLVRPRIDTGHRLTQGNNTLLKVVRRCSRLPTLCLVFQPARESSTCARHSGSARVSHPIFFTSTSNRTYGPHLPGAYPRLSQVVTIALLHRPYLERLPARRSTGRRSPKVQVQEESNHSVSATKLPPSCVCTTYVSGSCKTLSIEYQSNCGN